MQTKLLFDVISSSSSMPVAGVLATKFIRKWFVDGRVMGEQLHSPPS
jgi:hypothetical protein